MGPVFSTPPRNCLWSQYPTENYVESQLLLLLGTAIPELRGMVSEIRDVERSEDETVRISQCTKLDNVHRL